MVVFLLCGLWHGANWTFVIWGGVAGIMVTLETLLRKPMIKLCNKLHINLESKVVSAIRIGFMIILFSLSSILFRAQSLNDICIAFTNIFKNVGFGIDYTALCLGMNLEGFTYVVIALGIMCSLKIVYNKNLVVEIKKANYNYLTLIVFSVLLITFCWLYVLSLTDASGFQYFQF